MKTKDLEKFSPYCPECSACGEDGCCSALMCKMTKNCRYPKTYLVELKFGYSMNEWVQKNLLDEKLIPKELVEKYNQRMGQTI